MKPVRRRAVGWQQRISSHSIATSSGLIDIVVQNGTPSQTMPSNAHSGM